MARNPDHYDLRGLYTAQRDALGRLLDMAEVPQAEREELLADLKYRRTAPERIGRLARLIQPEPEGEDWATELVVEEMAEAEVEDNFEPILAAQVVTPSQDVTPSFPLGTRVRFAGPEPGEGEVLTTSSDPATGIVVLEVLADDGRYQFPLATDATPATVASPIGAPERNPDVFRNTPPHTRVACGARTPPG